MADGESNGITCLARCSRFATTIGVVGIGLALAANALLVVWRYGSRMPFYDDWFVLAAFADAPSNLWSWAFEHHNGHILPLPRIVTTSVWMTSDGSLRPLLISNVVMLTLSAAYCLFVLRRVRGHTEFEDLLVPFALLGSHAYADAMWAIMWVNALAASFVCAIVMCLVCMADRPRPAGYVAVLVATAFLAYQGATGLLYAIGLAPAIAFVGWRLLGSLESPRTRMALIAVTLVACLCVGAVLAYEATIVVGGEAGIGSRRRVVVAFFHMLAHGLGQIAKDHLAIGAAFMAACLVATVGFAFDRTNRRDPRAITAAAALCPAVVLSAAIAVSRVGGSGGFTERYVGMVMPIWASLRMAATVIESGGVLNSLARVALLVLAVSTGMSLTSHESLSRRRLDLDARLASGVAAGQSIERLAADHSDGYQIFPPERFAAQLRSIKQLGRGFLAHADDAVTFDWKSLDVIPSETRGCTLENETWVLSGESRMCFQLPRTDDPVDAVRVTFECEGFPWAIDIAGAGLSSDDEGPWGPSPTPRHLFPIDQGRGGIGLTYRTTFAFDQPVSGLVFIPPAGAGHLRIVSVEGGRNSPLTRGESPVARPAAGEASLQ